MNDLKRDLMISHHFNTIYTKVMHVEEQGDGYAVTYWRGQQVNNEWVSKEVIDNLLKQERVEYFLSCLSTAIGVNYDSNVRVAGLDISSFTANIRVRSTYAGQVKWVADKGHWFWYYGSLQAEAKDCMDAIMNCANSIPF